MIFSSYIVLFLFMHVDGFFVHFISFSYKEHFAYRNFIFRITGMANLKISWFLYSFCQKFD